MENLNEQNIKKNIFQTNLTIDDFEILQNLVNEPNKLVLKVKHKKKGLIYAIKAKKQEYFQNKERNIDYMREKEVLYDLTKKNFPHAVKLFADFQDSNFRYLVMEFCKGKSLDKIRGEVHGGYIDQKLVINILQQLLETLKYLHDTCHIIHRDIKPENIILSSDNNIKLIGFGISAYLIHQNKKLVSNKSIKGSLRYAPPEMIFYGEPKNYDYKIDVFSLGYSIYSLMNPSQGEMANLPQETFGSNSIMRNKTKLINKFYDTWLIEFVALLYEDNQSKRPRASEALNTLNLILNNPNAVNDLRGMLSSQKMPKDINIKNNKVEDKKNPLLEEREFQLKIKNDSGVLPSMKCLLYTLYKLDKMDFIKSQLHQLFVNPKINYQQLALYQFSKVLDTIKLWEKKKINNEFFNKEIKNFDSFIFNNNKTGLSGTRPIILFYIIMTIFKEEFNKYFNDNYKNNNIFDNIINNNFSDFNCVLPMNNQNIFNLIKNRIDQFKNTYKGPFADNFYFLIIGLSKCPSCGNLFGIRDFSVSQFLQLEVKHSEAKISDLIHDFFTPKIVFGNSNCSKCGCQGKKLHQKLCLNLPNYLILELEDKNKINFSDKIDVPLYNNKNYSYQFFASIYKRTNNNQKNFGCVLKIGNALYLYSDDTINEYSEQNINLDCPSLALYKNIST